jgi:membrane protein YdbS with pleckstrin-like domain
MEHPARRLDRRVLLLWWAVAVVNAVIVVIVVGLLTGDDGFPLPISAGIAGVAVVGAVVIPYLRYRRWRYEIRSRDLLLARGALYQVTTLIPFDRIQFVETRQGPLDRLFRLTRLVVYTAAGRAGQVPGLDVSEADGVREELSRVAGADTV